MPVILENTAKMKKEWPTVNLQRSWEKWAVSSISFIFAITSIQTATKTII